MIDPASEYSAAVAAVDSRIIVLRERIQRMYDQATSTGASNTGDGIYSGPSDRIGRQASVIVDAERQLQRLYDIRDNLDSAMISLIDTLPDADERTVLTLRMVYKVSHSKTAQGAGMSERTEYRVYKRGISHLKKRGRTQQYTKLRNLTVFGSVWQ